MARRAAAERASSSAETPEQRVNAAVEAFFGQVFNAETELRSQRQRMKTGVLDIDFNRVCKNDALYISEKFDLCEWWLHQVNTEKKHLLVYAAVPIVIALPASNAYQERTFSACTWFDDILRQRLKNNRFEMSVLLAVNSALLKCKVPTEEEYQAIVDKVQAEFGDTADDGAE